MKNFKLSVILVSAAALALGNSCSTTKGFGQDLQKVGSRLENSANESGGTAPPPSTGLTVPATPDAY